MQKEGCLSERISPLMTVKDAASWLQMNEQTIKKLCREGKIPCFKIGKNWRFDREELSEWVKSQKCAKSEA
jgi:excisionase family DNA binding protein